MLSILLVSVGVISCLSFLFMAAYVVNVRMKINSLEETIYEYEEEINDLKTKLMSKEDMRKGPDETTSLSYKDAKNINWKDVRFK